MVFPPSTPGLLLAGGLARRMGGGDKMLREIGGISILARAIATLAPQCDPLLLNANGDAARFDAYRLDVIADDVPNYAGPLAGILAGLDWVATHRPDAMAMLSAPADCPFLPHDLVARLHAARCEHNTSIAVAASVGRPHHVVALWDIGLRHDLRHALVVEDMRRVGGFIARHSCAVADWPASPRDPFFNANTEDDLREAERLLDGAS